LNRSRVCPDQSSSFVRLKRQGSTLFTFVSHLIVIRMLKYKAPGATSALNIQYILFPSPRLSGTD
jgi:hypothetical protein